MTAELQVNVTGRGIVVIVAAALVGFAVAMMLMATDFLREEEAKETSYTTLAFKRIGDRVVVEGLIGVSGTNPTIIMRSSLDYQIMIMVVNHDTEPHQFTIDGLNVSTEVLDPYGKKADVITLSGEREGTYTYRDALNPEVALGEFRVVRVTAFG